MISINKYSGNAQLKERLAAFVQFKVENPQKLFGNKDYPFLNRGPLAGYKHAGLTGDISIVY